MIGHGFGLVVSLLAAIFFWFANNNPGFAMAFALVAAGTSLDLIRIRRRKLFEERDTDVSASEIPLERILLWSRHTLMGLGLAIAVTAFVLMD
ncbi:hypothetical protein VCB98_07405 [Gammaproteobacteria bacterium AB-CW1]|uniref:Uncharacterized protein n=1 Tax=Natronospira elongata TaxID=3110268 RepID=A0AAP6JET4_9GAMM|nr:hypothetical protein [Gammaproteobacteria bacterium AB-CW1]